MHDGVKTLHFQPHWHDTRALELTMAGGCLQKLQPNDSTELALRESADHNHCCVARCIASGQVGCSRVRACSLAEGVDLLLAFVGSWYLDSLQWVDESCDMSRAGVATRIWGPLFTAIPGTQFLKDGSAGQGILLQQRDVAVAPDREYMLCVRSAMANAERVMSLFIEVRCQRCTPHAYTHTHVHAHIQHGEPAAPGRGRCTRSSAGWG